MIKFVNLNLMNCDPFFSTLLTNPIMSNISNISSIDTPNSYDKEKEVSPKSNKEYQYPFDDDIAEKK